MLIFVTRLIWRDSIDSFELFNLREPPCPLW